MCSAVLVAAARGVLDMEEDDEDEEGGASAEAKVAPAGGEKTVAPFAAEAKAVAGEGSCEGMGVMEEEEEE